MSEEEEYEHRALPAINDYTGCDVVVWEGPDGEVEVHILSEEAGVYFSRIVENAPAPLNPGDMFVAEGDPLVFITTAIPQHFITGVITGDGTFGRVNPDTKH